MKFRLPFMSQTGVNQFSTFRFRLDRNTMFSNTRLRIIIIFKYTNGPQQRMIQGHTLGVWTVTHRTLESCLDKLVLLDVL